MLSFIERNLQRIPLVLFSLSGFLMVVLILYNWFPQFAIGAYREQFSFWDEVKKPGNTGEMGDTIGGTLGPVVGLIAALLTGLAFWVQYRANENQRKDIRLERFENKYYELLRLHRANVEEMNIADRVKGRACFIKMFYELEFCYRTVEDYYDSTSDEEKINLRYSEMNLMDFSYRLFFFGTGSHSEKHYIKFLNAAEYQLYKRIKEKAFKPLQDGYEKFMNAHPDARFYTHKSSEEAKPNAEFVEFNYYPLDGHVNRLGHYYRHLFQTVNYIISQDFLSYNDKYAYVKTLRAQLSNFEQLLLYYNALAWFDEAWKPIFTRYRFIKNLPLPLADFHITPEMHFEREIEELRKHGIEMFEWHEKK